ncbi:MAG: hypothetical protein GY788_07920 [bacterium]|nr:hypothetical protein [bacterium]
MRDLLATRDGSSAPVMIGVSSTWLDRTRYENASQPSGRWMVTHPRDSLRSGLEGGDCGVAFAGGGPAFGCFVGAGGGDDAVGGGVSGAVGGEVRGLIRRWFVG